jgi:hypothetical protein
MRIAHIRSAVAVGVVVVRSCWNIAIRRVAVGSDRDNNRWRWARENRANNRSDRSTCQCVVDRILTRVTSISTTCQDQTHNQCHETLPNFSQPRPDVKESVGEQNQSDGQNCVAQGCEFSHFAVLSSGCGEIQSSSTADRTMLRSASRCASKIFINSPVIFGLMMPRFSKTSGKDSHQSACATRALRIRW